MKGETYTSFAEISNFSAYLGDAPLRQVGANMDRLRSLVSRAGFHPHVTLQAYAGETTQMAAPPVDSISPFAFMGAVKRVPLARAEYPTKRDGRIPFRTLVPLSLVVNTNELKVQVQEKDPRRLAPAETLATHLNKALVGGVLQAAWNHLVRDRPPRGEYFNAALQTIPVGVLLATSDSMGTETAAKCALAVASGVVAANGIRAAVHNFFESPSKQCFSAVPVWYLGRFTRVLASSYAEPLAKVITPVPDA
jgi:hypothetical protein